MDGFTMPDELLSVIDSEKIDFSVLAKRNQPGKQSFTLILFGIIWTAFTSIFIIAFFGPLFRGKEVHLESGGVATTGSWENFRPLLVPSLIIGFFVIVGIGILCLGLYVLLQKGGYFVATKTRLIKYYKGTIHSYSWKQFSGNMKINHSKGEISLELKTGKMVGEDRDKFVRDILYISGILNVMEVEKIFRERVKDDGTTSVNKQ